MNTFDMMENNQYFVTLNMIESNTLHEIQRGSLLDLNQTKLAIGL